MTERKIAIIGAGISGLTAAYRLVQDGFKVTVFESSSSPGGLAKSISLDGADIDIYYHFFCRGDHELFELLDELSLDHLLKWRKTRMGLYYRGTLQPFGNPLDLLFFDHFSFFEKMHFAWGILASKARSVNDWKKIEHIPAPEWLIKTFGRKAYTILHEPLIKMKFGRYMDILSAAWIWARIFRIGKSRTFFQEELLGYLEGNMNVLIQKLTAAIITRGGKIIYECPVREIQIENGAPKLFFPKRFPEQFNAVLSTVSTVVFRKYFDTLPKELERIVNSIKSIAVQCILFKLKLSFSPYFWMNVNDDTIPLAGLIETTNLNPNATPGGGHLLYLPQYLESTDPRFHASESDLVSENVVRLQKINPSFEPSSIILARLFRNTYAQPICETDFSRNIPPIQTSIPGVFMTDSSQLHPDDRTVSNSIGLGNKGAVKIRKSLE